jgi:hypothetical protein
MLNRIHHTGRNLVSPDAWKTRIIFRVVTFIAGLVANVFYLGPAHLPGWPVAGGIPDAAFIDGSQDGGMARAIAALGMTGHDTRSVPPR